jgi:predicted regulator of Ras-like GTPase activity (Roadblock/LC7/MglB family)
LNAVRTHTSDLSHEARNIQWLLQNFVEEVPGVHSVAVVSSDGLLLLTSQSEPPATEPPAAEPTVPEQGGGRARPGAESRMDLAAVVSGLASLTVGAARLMDGGKVRQTTVAMTDGMLFVTAISDGSLLGVHATADCDISVIGYHMALFVGRAGHVLTPGLRTELRQAMESVR